MISPRVASVNLGRAADLQLARKVVRSAIVKSPVAGRVAARGVNLEGDEQGDRANHGGESQAVYAYAAEDAAWWSKQVGRELGPAAFGENLTTEGIDVNAARLGERWRIGSVELTVTAPRIPCAKLAARMRDPRFVRRFAQAGRPGAYFAITREGELGAGDAIEVTFRPDHEVTVALVATAVLVDPSRLPELEVARPYFSAREAEILAERGLPAPA